MPLESKCKSVVIPLGYQSEKRLESLVILFFDIHFLCILLSLAIYSNFKDKVLSGNCYDGCL